MDRQDFIEECLREHNKYRSLHGSKPLRHSINLDKSAQEWAEDLIMKDNLHNSPISSRGEVGENISMRSSSSPKVYLTANDVSKQWYNDIKNYDFVKGSGPAGNFTQLVWRATEEVGFGIATVKGKCIVVAHYRPPGNVKGSYQTNVAPRVCEADSTDTPMPRSTPVNVKEPSPQPNDISSVFKMKLSHSRTSSMSDDETFERNIEMKPDEEKWQSRQSRQFVRDTIANINRYRTKHGVPKLKHNTDLDHLAQSWANSLVDKSTLSNSNNSHDGDRVGENIASRWSNDKCDYGPEEVVDHWYTENTKFDYETEPQNVQGIGNFTQMMWKSTHEIGVGKAYKFKPGDKRVIVVCNFFPAGNVLRKFKDNVLPIKSSQ